MAISGEFPQTGVGSGWSYQADAAQTRVQHGREGLVIVEDSTCVGAACQREHVVRASQGTAGLCQEESPRCF